MKIYSDNIKKYNTQILSLKKVLNRISLLRLLIFVISSIILIYLFSNNLFTPFFIIFPISAIGFAFVLKYHTKIAYLRKHTSLDRKSTRLNSSHVKISYAVFCLKKKTII